MVRQQASAEGDFSLVSMLLYNMAAFRAYSIALDDAFGRADTIEAHRVLLEAESTGNFDAGIGNAQLAAQVPLLRAQLMTVLGDFDRAVAIFDAELPRGRAEGQAHLEARYLADAAYCEVKLGRLDEAARRLRTIQPALQRMSAADDLAATHARLEKVTRALGRIEQAEGHRAEAQIARAAHEQQQERWRDSLRSAGLEAPETGLPRNLEA
jgi:tetratricopeptide (TPR) repeat protein